MNNIPGNQNPDHEKRLFAMAAEGDEAAFAELFHLLLPRLYPFIIKLAKSASAAREIIQETFLRVWLNRDKLDTLENPSGWLYRLAMNECYTYLRKHISYYQFFPAEPAEQTAGPDSYEQLDLKELRRLLEEAVNKLPAQRKKIYQMSRDQGKTIPEIAQELQLSPNTVKNTLVAALQFIREYLGKAGEIFLICIYLLWQP